MNILFNQLEPKEQEVFRLYKNNSPFGDQKCFAYHLNTTLGSGQFLPNNWEEKAALLDSIILRAKIGNEIIVYRATSDVYVQPHIHGNELTYPAYMSTAQEETAIRGHFAGLPSNQPAALLRIYCPVDTPLLDLESNIGSGGQEQELLLIRGSKFKVISVNEITDKTKMATLMRNYSNYYSSLKIYELEHIVQA